MSKSTLVELFALDPLSHTTETLTDLVKHLRGMRHQFNSAQTNSATAKAARGPTAAQKQSAAMADALGLDLGKLLK